MQPQLPNFHEFAELGAGKCHYRVEGPATGKTLMLIHGATVPAWQFDRLVPFLNQAGIRTIRLDLYGHGYSDRPAVVHDYALFTRQVMDLLDHLKLTGEIQLLGHSLGSAVAARLLLESPDRFGSLVLTAPMLCFINVMSATRLLRVHRLGEWLMEYYVVPMLVRRRTRRYRTIQDGRFVQMFRDQLMVPGFGRSLLSLIRSNALEDQRECYGALGNLAHPIMILSGADDQIVTPAHLKILESLLPLAQSHVIDAAEHALILTHPDQVASHVVSFLGRA